MDDPIIMYYYFDLTDTDFFCRELEKKFRGTGHTRQIIFKNWNCYNEEPGRDGDLFIYDAITMTSLVDKGYLHELPDIIDIDDMFPWIIDTSKVRKKTYGIPLMLCANTLICRREDDENIHNVMNLDEYVAIPLRTMSMYYYLQSFCNYQDKSGRYLEVMKHLIKLNGGSDKVDNSTLKEYGGVEDFNAGKCRYFMGFTENLRQLKPDDYVVRFANFSDNDTDDIPLFFADLVSIGNNVREEKLLDCLDLLEILADPQFAYDLCTSGGKLQYMLPAARSVYPRLAKIDPVYDSLYEALNREDNCIFRYGANFYEVFEEKTKDLLDQLKNEL